MALLQSGAGEGRPGRSTQRRLRQHGGRRADLLRSRWAPSRQLPMLLTLYARGLGRRVAMRGPQHCLISEAAVREPRVLSPEPCAAGLLGEYLPVAWHERLLRAACVGSAGAAGEVLQPLAAVSAAGPAGRPEKRPKARPGLQL